MTENFYKSSRIGCDLVKVKFVSDYTYRHRAGKNTRIRIYIGNLIVKELDWSEGDYINIEGDDKVVRLYKDYENKKFNTYGNNRGCKIAKVKNGYSFIVSFGCNYGSDKAKERISIRDYKVVTIPDKKYLLIYLEKGIMKND